MKLFLIKEIDIYSKINLSQLYQYRNQFYDITYYDGDLQGVLKYIRLGRRLGDLSQAFRKNERFFN